MAKGETELDEAKLTAAQIRDQVAAGRALSKKPITPEERARAAARRAKMSKKAKADAPQKPKKPQAYVSPDKPEARENETPNDDDPNKNIIDQLRKLPFEGKHRITFKNGKTHLLSPAIVNKALTLHANMHPRDKGDFQKKLAASLESFLDAIKNPENEAPKPKGKEALLAPKPLDKNFMANLDRLSKAYKEKQAAKKKG